MTTKDPQIIWEDYYQKMKFQRIEEASALWLKMQSAGVTEETVMALDFVHFSKVRGNADSLAEQLSENYNMNVIPAIEEGVWYIKGTSRPYGITLSEEQHLGWVEFMADVSKSYACVFSTWSLEIASLGVKFDSEQIESANK